MISDYSMVISNNFEITEVSGEYMLVPIGEAALSTRGIVAINEPVAFLLKHMNVSKSREELVNILISNYDVNKETASHDVNNMLEKLLNLGVIIGE